MIVNSKIIADVGGNVLGFYGFAAGVSGQSGYRTAANRWNKKREKKKGCWWNKWMSYAEPKWSYN